MDSRKKALLIAATIAGFVLLAVFVGGGIYKYSPLQEPAAQHMSENQTSPPISDRQDVPSEPASQQDEQKPPITPSVIQDAPLEPIPQKEEQKPTITPSVIQDASVEVGVISRVREAFKAAPRKYFVIAAVFAAVVLLLIAGGVTGLLLHRKQMEEDAMIQAQQAEEQRRIAQEQQAWEGQQIANEQWVTNERLWWRIASLVFHLLIGAASMFLLRYLNSQIKAGADYSETKRFLVIILYLLISTIHIILLGVFFGGISAISALAIVLGFIFIGVQHATQFKPLLFLAAALIVGSFPLAIFA